MDWVRVWLGAGKALLGVAGVAPVAAGALAIAGTLFAMKGFTISLETTSLVVQTSQNNMMF